MVVDAGGQRTPNPILDPQAVAGADPVRCPLDGDAAAALEASIAEMDSRLLAVISLALQGSCCPAHAPEHVARAVWAWLAEGDE